jgi:phosphoglycerate dehydrogenase-like enzyme
MKRIAILDDWQRSAEGLIDWSALRARAELVFFAEAFSGEDQAARLLADFDAVVAMRERTRFGDSLIARLPRLKLLSFTGARNAAVDTDACTRHGVQVCNTSGEPPSYATSELALGLMLAAARLIAAGDAEIRAGRFQQNVPPGIELTGRTLGIVGLGRLGGRLARFAQAIGMNVVAWSQNLTDETARAVGIERLTKEELLRRSDVVSLHLVLSARSRNTLAAPDLALLRDGAIVVNTSRAGLVDQAALLAEVRSRRLVAALDVFADEPLPTDDPWRSAPNTVLTPHLGYVTRDNMAAFYRASAENLAAWLDGAPIRTVNRI